MSINRKLAAGIAAVMAWLFISGSGQANNIAVTRMARLNQAVGSHWMVRFDITWTNSWRCDLPGAGQSAPTNYDAAWVFMKYRTNNVSEGVWGDWKHASLGTNASDHVAPAGSTISVGLDRRADAWGTNGVGVFIFRSANGSGLFTANNVRLRWNYAADGVADNAEIELKVCAIEMVYVPTGAFYAGSRLGDNSDSYFYSGGDQSTSFQITNENELTIGNVAGQLYYATQPNAGDQTGILSNAFPKGYSAFYGMKYEITQAQYVDFLNMLTRAQQPYRFVSTTTGEFMNVNSGKTSPEKRNGVQLISTNGTIPRVYANNLDMSNPPNSTNDGQWIACNWTYWPDLAAYLDWSGLRPITELEFEKAGRGPNAVVLNEYAFGSTSITRATNTLNSGMVNESVEPTTANGVYAFAAGPNIDGPTRVGSMGVGGDGVRATAGAGYYGMMEMSGNVTERPVTVGRPIGRAFTGEHGDGALDSNGNADMTSWPGTDGDGMGFRGASYGDYASGMRFADRTYGAQISDARASGYGGRGVRTAP